MRMPFPATFDTEEVKVAVATPAAAAAVPTPKAAAAPAAPQVGSPNRSTTRPPCSTPPCSLNCFLFLRPPSPLRLTPMLR